MASRVKRDKWCSIDGCGQPHSAFTYCNMHYQLYRRHGDPLWGLPRLTIPQRFERLIDKDGPVPDERPDLGRCWIWTQTPAKGTGYGDFRAGRNLRWLAHRYSYELYVGPIPDELVIDHLCRNRICVNPRHLEPVEHGENILRGWAAAPEKRDLPRGVMRTKSGRRFTAYLRRCGVTHYLGTFDTPEDANTARVLAIHNHNFTRIPTQNRKPGGN